MMKKILFLKVIKKWFLSNEEKSFIKKDNTRSYSNNNLNYFIQCPHSIDYIPHIKNTILEFNNINFYGIMPKVRYTSLLNIIFPFIEILYSFHYNLINRKFKKIYRSFGIEIFYESKNLSSLKAFKNFIFALKYFIKTKSKEELLNHQFKEIDCGDLIYDSYLRFNRKPTLNIYDINLLFYIWDCYNQVVYFDDLIRKNKVNAYFSSYSSYIAHGIPVRVFLKYNLRVFTQGLVNLNTNCKIKELFIDDTTHVKPHWKYKSIFNGLPNKNELSKLGYKKLANRFKGYNDLAYMKLNQYSKDYKTPIFFQKLDGVVFIGDFYDSPHVYRSMVFNDFYEWLIFTIEFSLENKINLGFKTHPNQIEEGDLLIKKIMYSYPQLNWVDPLTSNNIIFKSGIKFGVSLHGSVLPELAFNNIIPICCGDNPTSNFDFVFEAKTKSEYANMLKNYKNLSFNQDLKYQLGAFYYMNQLYKKFEFNLTDL